MNEHRERLQKLLPLVEKPARYIGGELGQIVKPKQRETLRFALCFPEIYEIGMSHHGGRLLYHAVNACDNLACERVFCPRHDLAELMRRENIPLLSLESKIPLSEFDVIGFSLEYELSYTNIFEMLDLAGIPFFAADRNDSHPLVIAGGPCVFNPEPVAPIFDLFVIGDAEEELPALLELIKNSNPSRSELLRKLATRRGIYVPQFYKPIYRDSRQDGFEVDGDAQFPIRSIELPELPPQNYPERPIVPWIATVHDRLGLEIMRGCGRGCRFCAAGWIYRPVREREVNSIIEEIKKYTSTTGWEEVGLLSLSATDYSGLKSLLSRLNALVEKDHTSISVPSIRPEGLDDTAISVLGKIRKSSITFAPEAATERLRNVINKPFDEKLLFEAIERVYRAGWRTVKLYFMIGLPTETEEDILAIARSCNRANDIARRNRGQLNVSISPFVPKPHTPFAWEPQDNPEILKEKTRLIRKNVSGRVKIRTRAPELPLIESVLSRGDRRLADVLRRVWELGGGFDAWRETFDPDSWERAFEEAGIDISIYTGEQEVDFTNPWEIIDKGIPKRFILSEREKAYRGENSPDCAERGGCEKCGICDFPAKTRSKSVHTTETNLTGGYGRRIKRQKKTVYAGNASLRLRYAKKERLRWLSHLDITKAISRAIRRSGLRVAYSSGHH
ncbi:TIGR03960 family B12-binding radical SAM protein, partial [bacterium]